MRRAGVMLTSMRRNYATPTSVRRHFDITCLHAKSCVVHHRGLAAVDECKPTDIQMECSIFVYRLNSFSISEEYASVHCRNYASHQISESYAERILFFIFFCNLSHPTPTLPYWSVLYPRCMYFGKYFLTIEYGILGG